MIGKHYEPATWNSVTFDQFTTALEAGDYSTAIIKGRHFTRSLVIVVYLMHEKQPRDLAYFENFVKGVTGQEGEWVSVTMFQLYLQRLSGREDPEATVKAFLGVAHFIRIVLRKYPGAENDLAPQILGGALHDAATNVLVMYCAEVREEILKDLNIVSKKRQREIEEKRRRVWGIPE